MRKIRLIGIVNIQWFDNPGAVWLAYSLQEVVKEIKPNEKVTIIDYAAGGGRTQQERGSEKIFSGIKKMGRAFFYVLPQNRRFRWKLIARHNKYEEFRMIYLDRTPRFTSVSSEVLKQEFSACIVGSDVVWKAEIAEETHSKVYFLQFANKGVRKIAYAASIGTDDINVLDGLKETYRKLISDFDFISMRENSSAQYVQQLTEKKVYNVLDPVFLNDADAYKKLIENKETVCEQKYIYVYMLTYNKELVSTAISVAKKNDYKVVYDLHTKEDLILRRIFKDCGIAAIDAGPLDFLALIANAELVLCDSFHGTAFSIILHKNFYTFGRKNNGIDISARMRNLLEQFSLMDRYCVDEMDIKDEPIDYATVELKLQDLRERSIQYLKEALLS